MGCHRPFDRILNSGGEQYCPDSTSRRRRVTIQRCNPLQPSIEAILFDLIQDHQNNPHHQRRRQRKKSINGTKAAAATTTSVGRRRRWYEQEQQERKQQPKKNEN